MAKERLSVQQCRKLLGDTAINSTDEEILQVRDRMYELASVTVDAFHEVQAEFGSFEVEELNHPDIDTRLIDLGWDLSDSEQYIADSGDEENYALRKVERKH
jgi:hypothetical protein